MKKLTFIEYLSTLLGYKYVANKNTKEIHDLQSLHHNCHKELMSSKSKKYLTAKGKDELFASGEYNGCRWCMKLVDTD
jgi:hypothetical protein